MTSHTKANIAMIITVFLWGVSMVSIKILVPIMGAIGLTFYRFVISSSCIFIFIKASKGSLQIRRKDLPLFVASSFFGFFTYFYLQNSGLNLLSASEASILVATLPIFSLLAESIASREKIPPRKILLVLVSVFGVYMMMGFSTGKTFDITKIVGYALILGANISFVIYGFTSRPLGDHYSYMTIVFYQGLFGTIILGAVKFLETTPAFVISPIIVINLLFLAIFCSGLTYYLYNYALKHIGISTSNLYLNLIPVITVISSNLVLGERVALHQIGGGLLVLIAVTLVNRDDRMQTVESETAAKKIA